MANVLGAIADALSGKSTPADPGTLNKKGFDARPIPIPASVQAAKAAAMAKTATPGQSGLYGAMAAHADKVHPVK